MEFKEWSWISRKVFLLFRNHLHLWPELSSTKNDHVLVFSPEWEKWYSKKQEAKFITKISKTEVENDVKLSKTWTGSTIYISITLKNKIKNLPSQNLKKKITQIHFDI